MVLSKSPSARGLFVIVANRRTRVRWGGAVLEMAVVAPLFVFFIFGQIESARLGMVAQVLATAAREGCRAAVINGNTTTQATIAKDAIRWSGVSWERANTIAKAR